MKIKVARSDDRSRREVAAPVPDIISMDDLAVLTDDALIDRLRMLDSTRDQLDRNSVRPWEVEIAYVRREFQLRRYRHQLHDDYLRYLDREADELLDLENRYPVADLDNSAFMFFN